MSSIPASRDARTEERQDRLSVEPSNARPASIYDSSPSRSAPVQVESPVPGISSVDIVGRCMCPSEDQAIMDAVSAYTDIQPAVISSVHPTAKAVSHAQVHYDAFIVFHMRTAEVLQEVVAVSMLLHQLCTISCLSRQPS